MFNITFLSTRHGESGKCNSLELYNIILQLNPEVIFDEIPPSLFEEHYYTRKDKLETNAIKMYSSDHNIKHIPVDLDIIMPQPFWDRNKYLFGKIEKNNSEFCKYCDYDSQYARYYGFNYLNSKYNIEINKNKDNEMEKTLKILDKKDLYEAYEAWIDINEKRENEWIINIYKYCKENIFEKGLFFSGGAHRESVITKIKKYKETEEINIKWNYIDYDNNEVKIIEI
jgi:hypothetical protein